MRLRYLVVSLLYHPLYEPIDLHFQKGKKRT